MERLTNALLRFFAAFAAILFSCSMFVGAAEISDELLEQYREDGYRCVYTKQVPNEERFGFLSDIFEFFHKYWWVVVLLILLVVLVVCIYRYWMYNKRKSGGEVQEFEEKKSQIPSNLSELKEEVYQKGDYSEFIRLEYLFMLQRLEFMRMLEFDEGKTPGEYVREVRLSDKTALRKLTGMFVRVRYGEHEASKEEADRAVYLCESVLFVAREMKRRGRREK